MRHTVHVLEITTWVVLVVGLGTLILVSSSAPQASEGVLVWGLGVFFVVVLAWLIASAVVQRKRRAPLVVLALGIALWASGSAVLNSSGVPAAKQFPAPGEWFFLASYVCMAAFLIADGGRRLKTALSTWLETLVICGGTACLAGLALLSPVSSRLGGQDWALLLALLYPLADIALGLLVVAQLVLNVRVGAKQAASIIAAFALFAFADTQFVANLQSGYYSTSVVYDACYAVAFVLITSSACHPPAPIAVVSTDEHVSARRLGPFFMVLGSLIAIAVLTFRPSDRIGDCLAILAVVTLLTAGARLVVALHEANKATEAFALARSDDLTGLPNRRALLADIDSLLTSGKPLTLMLLDLNGFKDVNDTLGHAAGDVVLQTIARRMRAALPAEVVLARLGGDEFSALVPGDDELRAMEIAREILGAVSEPMTVDGIEMLSGASIGIAVRAPSDTKSTELLRRADVAMYQAKVTNTGALLYDVHHDDFSREKLRIAEELRRGISEGQLELWYQPQIHAATQQICGLEALVRWRHPDEGLLSPAVFLPAARRAGLMLALSDAVVRMAAADLKRWRSRGFSPRIAVNCAPPELLSGAFLPRLYDAIRDFEVPAENFVVELTEDCFMNEPERARALLNDINAHRLQISIDDFGTGFSSLSYLRDLPVHELKIDRSFISAMQTDPRSRMIVASTFQMSTALGVRTVAEGVEDSATAADLIAMGVDVLQGYHLARPLPPGEVEPWVREWMSHTMGSNVRRADGS